jgi:hypothetical protein
MERSMGEIKLSQQNIISNTAYRCVSSYFLFLYFTYTIQWKKHYDDYSSLL